MIPEERTAREYGEALRAIEQSRMEAAWPAILEYDRAVSNNPGAASLALLEVTHEADETYQAARTLAIEQFTGQRTG